MRRAALLFCFSLFLGFTVSCGDSGTSPDGMDPHLDDLIINLDHALFVIDGSMRIGGYPPDHVSGNILLDVENKNAWKDFSGIRIPTADVSFVGVDTTFGTMPLETNWDGTLECGGTESIKLQKLMYSGPELDWKCYRPVYLDLHVFNADGDSVVFRSGTAGVVCIQ